jgi:hypothetical protein
MSHSDSAAGHRQLKVARASSRYGRMLAPLLVTALSLTFVGCVPTVATGPMSSEERAIDAVTSVSLDTSGDLTISEGQPSLVIRAPSDALGILTSESSGETLTLGTTPGPHTVIGEIRYELTVPDLEAITINGSGDVASSVSSSGSLRIEVNGSGDAEWTGLNADSVTVRIGGSGDVELDGVASELNIQVDGSGSVQASAMTAQDASVSVAGSGDADVTVSATLEVEISGSGQVTYSGDPDVEANVSGSGDVVRR